MLSCSPVNCITRMRTNSTRDGHMISQKFFYAMEIRPLIVWKLVAVCKMVGIFVALLMVSGFTTVSSGNSELSAIPQCICSGYNVTYECSVSGLGSTIWEGTAFSDCLNNRIRLRHIQFLSPGGATGTCNNEAIVGHSVGVQDTNCYISRLDVFVTSNIIGRTIICSYDNGSIKVEVARSTLVVTTDPLPPPTNILLISASSTQLIFSWDPVGSNCTAIKYNILAENCGSCPAKSNTTTAICVNPQPEPNAGVICSFRVQTEVCSGVIGGASNSSIATLKVPDIPVITVVPTYSQSEKTLIRISVRITETASFIISNGINGSSTSYNITYTNSTSGDICRSAIIPAPSCANGVCKSVFDDIMSSLCPSTGLSVTVFATNILGDGETSDEFTVDHRNNFVNLSYDTASKSITCAFINKEDISEKSCSLVYGVCEQQQVMNIQENSTGNQIVLVLDNLDDATYCYVATVSNSTFTVIVIDGKIDLSDSTPKVNIAGAIAGGLIGGIIIIILILGTVILLIIYMKCIRPDSVRQRPTGPVGDLEPAKDNRFQLLLVESTCELADFIQQKALIYQRGAVFYNFTREKEDIDCDKEVILMDKKTKKFYTGKKACRMIGAPGKDIPTPNIPGYDVFVQSMGIGRRPLEAGSRILYDCEANRSQPSNETKKLEPVDTNRFKKIEVDDKGGQLRLLIERANFEFKPGCAFFEFMNDVEDIGENKEVIIMEESKGKMFTGPAAHYMIGAPGREIARPELPGKRVFVQSLYKGRRFIHGNTLLLYEKPVAGSNPDPTESETLNEVIKEHFKVLYVEKDCGLRSFVESKGLIYVARSVFFEFVSEEEDISKDKEIILMDKDTNRMFTGRKAKKMIGAPGDGIKKPTSINKKYRVFIQNGGAGTQHLMAGTHILYDEKYKF